MERDQSEEQEGHGAGTGSERTKLDAQISLKADASLLKLCKFILPNVKTKLSTGILIPISKFAAEYQKWWCHIMYNQYNE